MKSNKISLYVLIIFTINLYGQVGINTDNIHPSAMLDVLSRDKGFLPPRLTTEQRNSINDPAIGLTIYNKSANHKSLEIFTGVTNDNPTGWKILSCQNVLNQQPPASNYGIAMASSMDRLWSDLNGNGTVVQSGEVQSIGPFDLSFLGGSNDAYFNLERHNATFEIPEIEQTEGSYLSKKTSGLSRYIMDTGLATGNIVRTDFSININARFTNIDNRVEHHIVDNRRLAATIKLYAFHAALRHLTVQFDDRTTTGFDQFWYGRNIDRKPADMELNQLGGSSGLLSATQPWSLTVGFPVSFFSPLNPQYPREKRIIIKINDIFNLNPSEMYLHNKVTGTFEDMLNNEPVVWPTPGVPDYDHELLFSNGSGQLLAGSFLGLEDNIELMYSPINNDGYAINFRDNDNIRYVLQHDIPLDEEFHNMVMSFKYGPNNTSTVNYYMDGELVDTITGIDGIRFGGDLRLLSRGGENRSRSMGPSVPADINYISIQPGALTAQEVSLQARRITCSIE